MSGLCLETCMANLKSVALTVFARDSILYAKRACAIAIPSVCLSVCLSHEWISQKR